VNDKYEHVSADAGVQAVLKHEDGRLFKGDFRDGKKTGRVCFERSHDNSTYTGPFQNGKKHGKGKFVDSIGFEYRGMYEKGKRCGHGELTY